MTSVTMGHLCHCPGIPELVISSSIRHDAQGSAARSAQAWKVRGIVKSLRGPAPTFERDVYVNDGEVSYTSPSRRRRRGREVDRHDPALLSLSQQTRGKADGGFKEVQLSQCLPTLIGTPGSWRTATSVDFRRRFEQRLRGQRTACASRYKRRIECSPRPRARVRAERHRDHRGGSRICQCKERP